MQASSCGCKPTENVEYESVFQSVQKKSRTGNHHRNMKQPSWPLWKKLSLAIQRDRLCKLCDNCRGVFDNWATTLEMIQAGKSRGEAARLYDTDGISWRARVDEGCGLCTRLFDSLGDEKTRELDESLACGWVVKIEVRSNVSDVDHENDYLICANVYRGGDHLNMVGYVRLFLTQAVKRMEIGPSTGSDPSLAFAKRWIEECRGTHSECNGTSTVQLPTRLIKISPTGLRLINPINSRSKLEYITLSHCWGTLEILKLTKSNIDTLMTSIPIKDLCKTFQDAILVTQALGFSHIWIDSLCIIQDDELDWGRESALMSEVYGNAVVNIAASKAEDGSVGLLSQREESRVARCFIRTNTLETYELWDFGAYSRYVEKSPLLRRAWAFQERYLANRTLFFTKQQIFCECRHHTTCEAWPEGIPVNIEMLKKTHTTFPTRKYLSRKCKPDRFEWENTVSLYSQTQVTYAKDKLVALSGVARKYQERTQDQYVAGLWRNSLLTQLCWIVDKKSRQTSLNATTTIYRAPSWSWASIDQPVSWDLSGNYNWRVGHANFIDIVDIILQPYGPDPLGQLEDAMLKIRCGPMIKYRMLPRLAQRDTYVTSNEDNTEFCIESLGSIYADNDLSVTEDIYCLPTLGWIIGKEGFKFHGLMLKPSNRGKGCFARCGALEFPFAVQSYRQLMDLFSRHPDCLMEKSLYEDVLEGSRYNLVLV